MRTWTASDYPHISVEVFMFGSRGPGPPPMSPDRECGVPGKRGRLPTFMEPLTSGDMPEKNRETVRRMLHGLNQRQAAAAERGGVISIPQKMDL